MTELRHQTEEQERNNVKDHINNRNKSIEVVKILVINKEKKSIIEEEFQQQVNEINKNIRNIEMTKGPTRTNGNVAILTIAKTETVESKQLKKSITQENGVQIKRETRQTQSTIEPTLIHKKQMTGKKAPILTDKKKEHNAMHVGLETTNFNIVAKTAICLYHTEKRST